MRMREYKIQYPRDTTDDDDDDHDDDDDDDECGTGCRPG